MRLQDNQFAFELHNINMYVCMSECMALQQLEYGIYKTECTSQNKTCIV